METADHVPYEPSILLPKFHASVLAGPKRIPALACCTLARCNPVGDFTASCELVCFTLEILGPTLFKDCMSGVDGDSLRSMQCTVWKNEILTNGAGVPENHLLMSTNANKSAVLLIITNVGLRASVMLDTVVHSKLSPKHSD